MLDSREVDCTLTREDFVNGVQASCAGCPAALSIWRAVAIESTADDPRRMHAYSGHVQFVRRGTWAAGRRASRCGSPCRRPRSRRAPAPPGWCSRATRTPAAARPDGHSIRLARTQSATGSMHAMERPPRGRWRTCLSRVGATQERPSGFSGFAANGQSTSCGFPLRWFTKAEGCLEQFVEHPYGEQQVVPHGRPRRRGLRTVRQFTRPDRKGHPQGSIPYHGQSRCRSSMTCRPIHKPSLRGFSTDVLSSNRPPPGMPQRDTPRIGSPCLPDPGGSSHLVSVRISRSLVVLRASAVISPEDGFARDSRMSVSPGAWPMIPNDFGWYSPTPRRSVETTAYPQFGSDERTGKGPPRR